MNTKTTNTFALALFNVWRRVARDVMRHMTRCGIANGTRNATRNVRRFCAIGTMSALALVTHVSASPLTGGGWTQVGLAQADGNLFNGNCNLDLSGACTFNDGRDFWRAMPTATEMLFVTGDDQYWGQASYASVRGLITAATGTFTPNLTWIDAGRNGASIGAATGNILFRNGIGEDPWVTLEGSHCAHLSNTAPCNEILWGETAYVSLTGAHVNLQSNHGGLQVWARNRNGGGNLPEPTSLALIALALAGLALCRRHIKAQR